MKHIGSYLLLTALVLYGGICVVVLVDAQWHRDWDSAIYLLAARNLANAQGYTYLDQPFFLRPPGFSYLLSWIVSKQGEFHFYPLNCINVMIAMGSLAALYFLLRLRHGPRLSAAITLLFGTSPLFVRSLDLIMSEFLFLLLFYTAMRVQLASDSGPRRGAIKCLVCTLLFSASIYVRTVGLVLLPGIVADTIRNKAWSAKLFCGLQAVLMVLLLLPWLRYASNSARAAPRPATQLKNFSYATAMFHADSGDPSSPFLGIEGWFKRIRHNGGGLIQTLGVTLLHTRSRWAGVAVGLCVVTGFVFYTYRRGWSLVEWFLVPYLAVILVHSASAHRLALPIVPFCYSYLFLAVECVARREGVSGNKRLGERLAWLVFVLLLALNVAFFAKNTEATSDEELARQSERRLAEWIRENVEDDARLLYDFAPSLAVLTGRQVYSYRFLRRGSFVPQVDYAIFTGQENRLEVRLKESSTASWLLPTDDAHPETRIYRVVVPEGLRAGF